MNEESTSIQTASRSAQDILLFDPISPAWARDLKSAVYASPEAENAFAQALEAMKKQEKGRGDQEKEFRRAVGLLILGRAREALEVMAGVKADLPYQGFFLGQAHSQLGSLEEARETLEKALEVTPKDHDVRVAYLELITARHDAERIAHELEMGKHIEGTPDWYYFRGILAERKRDFETALDQWERCIDLDPTHQKALFRLAREMDRFGEEERALELYEEAVRLRPVHAETLMNLGLLYDDMEEYVKAERCFRAVCTKEPDNWRARMFLRDTQAALEMYYDEDQEKKEDRLNKTLRIPISDFELSVRSRNCLAKMEIRTLGDLVQKTEAELLSYKNFGDTSLQEIQNILRQKGLSLGMSREDIPAAIDSGDEGRLELGLGSDDPRNRPLADLELSSRAKRVMELLKITTLGDIAEKTEAELLACPNFGQTSLNELKQKLEKFGLGLKE